MPGGVCTGACPEASADRQQSSTILAGFQDVPRVLAHHTREKSYTQRQSASVKLSLATGMP